ncbi:MAG: pantoate--beta-alanine ligase [Hyphomicrobiales bacterium]|nr:MAG: pantoate--beta-alanine ligase [Hyphomicrobiales bacterium]
MMTNAPAIVTTPEELRRHMGRWKAAGETSALVPTMGALHEGHLSLVRLGRAEARRVIASIFVNPTQFGPGEDYESYPRQMEDDRQKLASEGCDLIYAPRAQTMYPEGAATSVHVDGPLTQCLCGLSRPHHFAGVATIVTKLLVHTAPDIAIFGEKDYQQLQVIRRLVTDLGLPVRILGGPIMRDEEGLALSSRNAYLSEEQLAIARSLNKEMRRTAARIAGGVDISEALEDAEQVLLRGGFDRIDYLEARDAATLEPVSRPGKGQARLFAAVFLGSTRLIDNMPVA